MLGSRSNKKSSDVSIWDVRALAHIIQGLGKYGTAAKSEIHVFGPTSDDGDLSRLIDEKNVAICSIGAPKASVMSQLLLQKMFEPNAQEGEVPFRFCWPELPAGCNQFSLDASELSMSKAASKIRNGNACGIQFHEKLFTVDFTTKSTKNYSIFACKQQSNSRFWLVLAGASGPGTEAACHYITSDSSEISVSPNIGRETVSITNYGLLEIDSVTIRNHNLGDTRRIARDKFGNPRVSLESEVLQWPRKISNRRRAA